MKRRTAVGLGLSTVIATVLISPWAAAALPAGPVAPAAATGDVSVQVLVAPWCHGVPLTVVPGSGGQAGFTEDWHPVFGRSEDPDEFIKIGSQWPEEHAGTQAVALHECAHILQYRAYDYDASALERDMARLYPHGPSSGTEHMADCISDLMGAERSGTVEGRGYSAGYGGACTTEQSAAAAEILAGRRPS